MGEFAGISRPFLAWRQTIRVLAVACCLGATVAAHAAESGPQWIWPLDSAASDEDGVAVAFFRRSFQVKAPGEATIDAVGSAKFEIYLNGRRVGGGSDWRKLRRFDVGPFLVAGENVLAVRAEKPTEGPPGFAARFVIREQGGAYEDHSTGRSWRAAADEQIRWEVTDFDDAAWAPSAEFGMLETTAPWAGQIESEAGAEGRYTVMNGFRVEEVVPPAATGSLVSMAFDDFGRVLAGRENGPLLVIRDTDQDGVVDSTSTYCEELRNCQGVTALNGEVFAVADGPEGAALYRLRDDDRDGKIDQVKAILRFQGALSEHGPHAVQLGPDGLLYVMTGNHTRANFEVAAAGPYLGGYEGDLLTPKMEDPGGHAVGVTAPGGVVYRTDAEGAVVEAFAGGLRNAYDLAFNREGELFTYDSDMEWDQGLAWYRPTRLLHVTAGGEFGWRSGWSKFAEWYRDASPSLLEMGGGSPTGVVFYNHFAYPGRFQNSLFACDWTRGRIMHIRLRPSGAGYSASSELFVEGRPLAATDIDVGPDGWLYFCTGGRGAEGGVYRIVAENPAPAPELGEGVEAALMQPQPDAPWAQQKILHIKTALGEDWGASLAAVVRNPRRRPAVRAQALHLLQLYGPFPSPELLVASSESPAVELRVAAAYLLGVHADAAGKERLIAMLDDPSPFVRRVTCEAILRCGAQPPAELVIRLLGDEHRATAQAAMRLLQATPRAEWSVPIIDARNVRQFVRGGIALATGDPTPAEAAAILARAAAVVEQPIDDADFLDLLRLVELTLATGAASPADAPQLARLLGAEYPSGDARMNRLLVRLVVRFGDREALARLIVRLASDASLEERLHAAICAAYYEGWTLDQRLELFTFLEHARAAEGVGYSYQGYIDQAEAKVAAGVSSDDALAVLVGAVQWPHAALTSLAASAEKLSQQPDAVEILVAVDEGLSGSEGEAVERLRNALLAVLAENGSEPAMRYLRTVFSREPERRVIAAMGLAQSPIGANWPLLVEALPALEGAAAVEVLTQLRRAPKRSQEAESLRQVILLGLKLGEQGGVATGLLEHWTGAQHGGAQDSAPAKLRQWQTWYAQQFPDMPPATPPKAQTGRKWSYDELAAFLDQYEGQGDASAGALVFEQARCAACHRHGVRGVSLGPDLTTLRTRFRRRDVLESIYYPSHVVSDQYAAQTVVLTDGRVLTGLLLPDGPDRFKLTPAVGETVLIAAADIEERQRSPLSAMPEGLLDDLELEQIGNLFQFLMTPPLETAGAGAAAIR